MKKTRRTNDPPPEVVAGPADSLISQSYKTEAFKAEMAKLAPDCPECGEPTIERRTARLSGTCRRETFTIKTDALVCLMCGFKTVPRDKMGEFAARIEDAYSVKHRVD